MAVSDRLPVQGNTEILKLSLVKSSDSGIVYLVRAEGVRLSGSFGDLLFEAVEQAWRDLAALAVEQHHHAERVHRPRFFLRERARRTD